MSLINKPSQPLIPPTDIEEVEEIAASAASAAIAADDTHAPLVDNLVPSENLPSYVDDVLEFADADSFPEEGEVGKIYVALDSNLTYRWSGAAYIQVGGASLAAGDGINIANDIVSADLPYLNENLDFADTDYVDQEISALSGAIQHFGNGFNPAGSDSQGYSAFDVSLESMTPEIEPILEGEEMGGTLSNDDVQTLRDMPGQVNIKIGDQTLLATFTHIADDENHVICYSFPVAKHGDSSSNPSLPQFTFNLDSAVWALEDTELATAAALASTNSTLSQVTEDMALAVQNLNGDVSDLQTAVAGKANQSDVDKIVGFAGYLKLVGSGFDQASCDLLNNLEENHGHWLLCQDHNNGRTVELAYVQSTYYSESHTITITLFNGEQVSNDPLYHPLRAGTITQAITKPITPSSYIQWKVCRLPIGEYSSNNSQWDTTPTGNSTKPVTSGGVKAALNAKQNTISDLDAIRSGATAGTTAVQPADVADDMEVVAYQTQTPLSAEQLAKAEAGKLAIYKDNFVYTKFTQDGNVVSFQALEHMSENGTYTPGYNVRIRRYTLTLDRSTRMLNDAGYQQGVSVADTSANFLDAGAAPVANGKKLIREANLVESLAAKADKPADILSTWVIPDDWENLIDILEAQPMDAYQWYAFLPHPDDPESETLTYKNFHDVKGNYYSFISVDVDNKSYDIYFYPADARPVKDELLFPKLINGIRNALSFEYDAETGDKRIVFGEDEQVDFIKTAFKKQDCLVSGTNIKTVNGNSLLGSGDLTISGGVTEARVQEMIDAAIGNALAASY